ncbi:hypothetical protein DTO169E5_7775 [Paecilomyces variotii]|nr:hypothetical protein DTO169E5_7775 [Paecilomyces variotii]KAJ9353515.1 hypothetical protein DTO027B9_5217 [Paecilomyces variotii]KAJ9382716.1 hypothetical protein DTO063F5_5555 [Paecilomyces variotii]
MEGRADQRSLLAYLPTPVRQAYLRRPRSRRSKVLFLATATGVLIFFFIALGSRQSQTETSYWVRHPSHYASSQRPEDSSILSPSAPQVDEDGTLPSSLKKSNPSFHLLIPATKRSSSLCKTVTSAMILDYPPPTLIGYGKEFYGQYPEHDATAARVSGINSYLTNSKHLSDNDLVLIVDGLDVFFQLPPDILIRRFHNLLKENNEKLKRKYGVVVVQNPDTGEIKEIVQKYEQRVVFGAGKLCFPNPTHDVACVTVPQSTLPPDAYGLKTDTHPDGHLNRPRYLQSGAIIGEVADLRLIYSQVEQSIGRRRDRYGDQFVLGQLFGKQEYVRELERRRTSNRFKEWMYNQIGISEATNLTGIEVNLEQGRRYEFGIGLDYESRLFWNMLQSRDDVEWITYNNLTETSKIQQRHGVPRERITPLPSDIYEHAPNPFIAYKPAEGEVVKPPFNATVDTLPDPKKRSWENIPLMTNVHSREIPAIAHLNGDKKLRKIWWTNMWYHPWARALLRKYMRGPRGRVAALSSLFGGRDWWDLRGGRGGVWTDNDEWLDYGELCEGYEEVVFDDEKGPWGQEDGGQLEKPVYNQFGILIAGKGPPKIDPPQPPN